jgi:aryl-alcohol dehydrogenase-like predicted oxidoreductase
VAARLGLGTVQFGLDYGISNAGGRPSEEEVREILASAVNGGMDLIDTAAAYGDSEAVLGRCLPEAGIRLVTKTRPLRERTNGSDIAWISEGFARSLQRLRLDSVEGLLVHHAADLLGPSGDAIYAELVRLKDDGRVRRIGLSAYTGAEVDAALGRYDIDLIQIPVNVLDQRLMLGGQIQRLRARGVEIHVRSVFLQGLLLMEPANAPTYFSAIRPMLQAWRDVLTEGGMTPAEGAFAFVHSLDVDVVLVGVENAQQLQANQQDFSRARDSQPDFTRFALADEAFLNPSCWKLAA